MKIAVAADHGGFELKEKLKSFLKGEGHEVVDAGDKDYDPVDDYPKFAAVAADMVARGEADRAVVICDTGIGVDIVANKFPGVRSALVHDEDLAKRTREHNDTNVLALGATVLDEDEAKRITRVWTDTEFSGVERHARRIAEIGEIERSQVALLSEYDEDDE